MKATLAAGVAVVFLASAVAQAQSKSDKGATPAPLPAQELTVAKLPPRNPHWVYAADLSFDHMTDGRIQLFDGESKKRLGQIDAGFAPATAISPDGNITAIATTYFSRGSRGTRTDVVEFHDNRSLEPVAETEIPTKHAMTLPFAYDASFSSDGHFLYVANITPATSISVLDPVKHTFLGEIDTAGCVLAYPDGPRRVSALCESGKALTITLDDAGKEVSRQTSDALFDVDKDPAFVSAVRSASGYVFTTFGGKVIEVDFSSGKGRVTSTWPLLTDAERHQNWVPGGLQVTALHRALGRLYVAMHKGGPGSHKEAGSEIWVFDTATHKRLARWNLAKQKIGPLVAIQVSEDAQPQFSGLTENSDLVLLDGLTGKLRHIEPHFGSTSLRLINPNTP